jgi:hypothetical protein
MTENLLRTVFMALCALTTSQNCLAYGEWSGNVGVEWIGFNKDPLFNEQHRSYPSVSAEPEYYQQWGGGKRSFLFQPFARLSQNDSRRTHADIRELNFGLVEDTWELTAGISKVFWGITESQHLVDIINQTDLVENIDGEDKLGQPMVNITLIRNIGTLDLFLLPGFRTRSFPGKQGRPRFSLEIRDQNNPQYESGAEEKHVDLAARWYQMIGNWEIALSHFSGTSRTPTFELAGGSISEPPHLVPLYNQINQTGLEVQGAFGSWLWKLEAIRNAGFDNKSYKAAVGGFEHTYVLETGFEVGALLEYSWDERGRDALTRLQSDVFVATRLTFNDIQSTQVLAGVMIDTGGAGRSYNIEAERRIGDSWKVSLEARGVFHAKPGDFDYQFRRDNLVRLDLARYF